MNTFAQIFFTVLEALGVVGTLTTLFSAQAQQLVITWCSSHGSLLLWYLISTFVLYLLINLLKRFLARPQRLLDIQPYEDQIIQYVFPCNGSLEIGQAVEIWHHAYKEKKFLFLKRKIETPGRLFAVAIVDTYKENDAKKMTLKHIVYGASVNQEQAKTICAESYHEYYMITHIHGEAIGCLKKSKGEH